ncbi:MAG: hypothetical protein H6Q78_1654, partial [Candidatus Krumholzibacteriota bacterium]|nr:hypothetical protein [Candidatus Krumholzibacteriota bacterium]
MAQGRDDTESRHMTPEEFRRRGK